MNFLRRNWRTLLLLFIGGAAGALTGSKLAAQLLPVATEVVNAIPCTAGEVSAKCPAPQVVTSTAR